MNKKTKTGIGVTLAVLIIAAVVVTVLSLSAQKKTASTMPTSDKYGKILGQVGDYRVHQADITSMATDAQPYHQSTKQLVDLLLTNHVYSLAADQLGVTVNDTDVTNAFTQAGGNPNSLTAYTRATTARDLYVSRLTTALSGYTKGKFIIAHFDQDIPNPNFVATANETLANQEADQTYADQLITTLQNNIASHKMSFDQAMAAELADPKIGATAAPAMLQSDSFDTSNTDNPNYAAVQSPEIMAAIAKLSVGQVSAPLTGTISFDTPAKKDAVVKPGYYLLVTVTDRQAKKANYSSFDAMVATLKQQNHYQEAV